MIILSYNSRGLGRGIKWAAIRRLNLKHKVDLMCIQETKKKSFDKIICQSMWGDSTLSWDNVPSAQASSGLLCMWNNLAFEVERRVKGRNFLMLEGRWVKENQWLSIVNVYAPCDLAGKRALWDELRQLKVSNPMVYGASLGILTASGVRKKELAHPKGLLPLLTSQNSMIGYLRWSFRILSALVQVYLV